MKNPKNHQQVQMYITLQSNNWIIRWTECFLNEKVSHEILTCKKKKKASVVLSSESSPWNSILFETIFCFAFFSHSDLLNQYMITCVIKRNYLERVPLNVLFVFLFSFFRRRRVLLKSADSKLCCRLYYWQGRPDHCAATERDRCHHQAVQIQRLLPRWVYQMWQSTISTYSILYLQSPFSSMCTDKLGKAHCYHTLGCSFCCMYKCSFN